MLKLVQQISSPDPGGEWTRAFSGAVSSGGETELAHESVEELVVVGALNRSVGKTIAPKSVTSLTNSFEYWNVDFWVTSVIVLNIVVVDRDGEVAPVEQSWIVLEVVEESWVAYDKITIPSTLNCLINRAQARLLLANREVGVARGRC